MVNPHSSEDVSEGIGIALAMPKAERIRRWKNLMKSVQKDDVIKWRKNFIEALSGAAHT
jgi:trehalose 6-phosphate synthase